MLQSEIFYNKLLEPFYNDLIHQGIILVVAIIILIYTRKIEYILILFLVFFLNLVVGFMMSGSYEPRCSITTCPNMINEWEGPAYDVGLYSLLISITFAKLCYGTKSKGKKYALGIISILILLYSSYFFIKWWPVGYYNEMISDIKYYSSKGL